MKIRQPCNVTHQVLFSTFHYMCLDWCHVAVQVRIICAALVWKTCEALLLTVAVATRSNGVM